MAIHLPEPPPNTLDVVRREAPRLLQGAPGGTMRAMAESLPDVNVTQPHCVYNATIADVLSARVLANAVETSWRVFLVHQDNEPFAAAEVAGESLSHVNEGAFVAGTASAMVAAEQFAAGSHRDYELRLLRIPALYVKAVWLHAPDDDVLIPSAPAPEPLVANQTYDEKGFTDALRPLAETRNSVADTEG
jgi:hypothetical protein